jgi:hypothetical protein
MLVNDDMSGMNFGVHIITFKILNILMCLLASVIKWNFSLKVFILHISNSNYTGCIKLMLQS